MEHSHIKSKITPVILCGGSGTRLWPLSRRSFPKQFVAITGANSLLQDTALRATGPEFGAPVILTHSDFRFVVAEQMVAAGIDPGAVIIEPQARNTAPAILAAALYMARSDPQTLMLVMPSDHVIPDEQAFRDAVFRGIAAAQDGQLVTFGIAPDHPNTGYGYLETSAATGPDPAALKGFVEKPDRDRATQMIETGRFLWNAGIFLMRACDIIAAFETHAADMVAPVRAALEGGRSDLGFFRLAATPWARAEDLSIDYAVMEKAANLSVVRFDSGWSDLGDWDAVGRHGPRDATGVQISGKGNASAIECHDTVLRAENSGMALVGIGLRDIIAVATKDAVLVADRSRAQDVKQAVEDLRAQNVAQADHFPRDHRPWGSFEILSTGDGFQVKRIHVKPGAALSLQSHQHRAEHWVMVSGKAEVTVGERVSELCANQSTYIPVGAKHRLRNLSDETAILIEIQTGEYLGEDDIIRYEDLYARRLED